MCVYIHTHIHGKNDNTKIKRKKKHRQSWLKPTKPSPGCPLLYKDSSVSCGGRAGHVVSRVTLAMQVQMSGAVGSGC